MLCKPTPAGQIGIFPEHWAHWAWIEEKIDSTAKPRDDVRILNLFGYTGATTLFLASLGVQVTHVDASKPTVEWAKQNATLSGLDEAPTRWIVDDAVGFVRRELRRGRQYDAILLDPPTYGHGPKGKRWEILRDLSDLLLICWQLLSDQRIGVLLCGHSSHLSIQDLNDHLQNELGRTAIGHCNVEKSYLESSFGRRLDCGFAAKYSW